MAMMISIIPRPYVNISLNSIRRSTLLPYEAIDWIKSVEGQNNIYMKGTGETVK